MHALLCIYIGAPAVQAEAVAGNPQGLSMGIILLFSFGPFRHGINKINVYLAR